MRPELETFVAEVPPKIMKRLSKNAPSAVNALTLVDNKLPADEPIVALSFGNGYSDYGLLVLTDRRLLYVADSVQSWRFEEISKLGSNGKDIFGIEVIGQRTSNFGNLTNGPRFIVALNTAINESKLGPL
jgi:hypothetical protein